MARPKGSKTRLSPAERDDTWVLTSRGCGVDFLMPDWQSIDWHDIRWGLEAARRFGGHCDRARGVRPWSVADHLMLGWRLGASAAPWGPHWLLHDAHEAYTGNLPAPLKRSLAAVVGGVDPVAEIEARLDKAIHIAFGLSWPVPSGYRESIKALDLQTLEIERERQLPHHVAWPARALTLGELTGAALVEGYAGLRSPSPLARVFAELHHSGKIRLPEGEG